MSSRLAVLGDTVSILDQAATRLAATHDNLAPLFPMPPEAFAQLSELEHERLDAYAVRYARCQDLLFPAMRALGRALLEPKADRSFLDLFALMQKQGVTTTVDDWERQRSLRNAVSHEYPDAGAIVDILNAIHAATPEILSCVRRIEARTAQLAMAS